MEKTLHYDFSNGPMLFETLGLIINETIGTMNIQIGTVNLKSALWILTIYVRAFSTYYFIGGAPKYWIGFWQGILM